MRVPGSIGTDYEAAHDRVLEIFKDWKKPESFTIHHFVIRAGDYGGCMIVDTDKPTDIHYFTSLLRCWNSGRKWSSM